jgi:hypothetical protein
LVFTADGTLERTMSRYAAGLRSKAHVIPHAFDPVLYADGSPPEAGPLVVRFLGSFYGRRRPTPLMRALETLVARDATWEHRVRVELVGAMPADMRREVERARLPEGMVAIVPSVSYEESLALMRGSSVLIAIDAPDETSVFLASKVVDYVGAGRPIVGQVPPGAAADLINRLGGWVADPSDPEASATALADACVAAERTPGEWGDPRVRDEFGIDRIGARRGALLRSMVERV